MSVLQMTFQAEQVLASINEILRGRKSIEVKTAASGTKVYSVIDCPFKRH